MKRFCFMSIIPDYLRFISEHSLHRMGEKPSLEVKDMVVFLMWIFTLGYLVSQNLCLFKSVDQESCENPFFKGY